VTPEARVPLAPRTTLGVGGPARWLVEAATEDDVRAALAFARERSVPTLVLGGGSNLLVADRGFEGLVLRVRTRGVRVVDEASTVVRVDVGAGERWDDFVAHAVASGWAGVECLAGIPGDVGATPIQNVGAYGQEVRETIERVRVVDRATGEPAELDRDACAFGYRDSVFKREARDRWVVVAVSFALRPGGAPAVAYAELARCFAGRAAEPSLAEVREAVVALRRSKSMVLDPDAENGKSAGSFFMNPTVSPEVAAEVRARAIAHGALAAGETMPAFPAADGRMKLSAGWLIERAGFPKGTSDGPVGLSTKHALAVVNRGGATASQIVAFALRVRDGVEARFGVALVAEPVLVGFTPDEIAGLG
jgi:UDP-N-acetylmuramate dehydrogenase